jgi:hypothetical protein
MLTPDEIRDHAARVTKRRLSDGALSFLHKGTEKYSRECSTILGRPPSKGEAVKGILEVLSGLDDKEGVITASEVLDRCRNVPYPLSIWWC